MLFKSLEARRELFGSCVSTKARSAHHDRKKDRRGRTSGARRLQLESLERRALLSVTIGTDLPDYAPGSTALINGSGFALGETVQLNVSHADGTPAAGGTPWQVVDGDNSFTTPYEDANGIWHAPDLDGKVDGNIQTSWYVDPIDEAGATMLLSATALSTGEVAQTTFTDASTVTGLKSSLTGNATSPEGSDFTLTVNGTGFTTSSQITFNGKPLTTTRVNATQLTAPVTADLIPNETATNAITVSVSTGGSLKGFTITEADSLTLNKVNIAAVSTGAPGSSNPGTTFSGQIATMSDTYDNQNPAEFNVSINWGDGSATDTTTGTVTRTAAGAYSVTGSHIYTALGFTTSVRGNFTTPASGTYSLPIANNGTTNFASSGSLVVFTSNGYQTISYTGKTTGTNTTTFTGCSGGYNATIAASTPVFQSYGDVTVKVTDASPGSANATTTSHLTVNDGVVYTPSTGGTTTTVEGTTYGVGSTFSAGSVGVSTLAGFSYRMLITSGGSSAWASTYTLGVNTIVWVGSITNGSIGFGDEGMGAFTSTLYGINGNPVATGSGNVKVFDAGLSYASAINAYPAVENGSTGTIQLGKFFDSYVGDGDHTADFTVTVHWGDGASDSVTPTYVGSNTYTVNGSHTYAEEGSYSVTYDVKDDAAGTAYDAVLNNGGGVSSYTGLHTANVTVSDPNVVALPVAPITGNTSGPIGSKALATFTDPGGAEAIDGTHYSALVNWGSGYGTNTAPIITYDSGSKTFTVSAIVPYTGAGSYSPVVTINHESTTAQMVTDSVTVLDTTPPTVTDFRVLYGAHGSYSLIGSSRLDLPWQITGVQVVFSENVLGVQNSLIVSGGTVTGITGSGSNTLTWSINTLTLGSFTATLATSGMSGAITDLALNSLMSAPKTAQNFKVLWGDVTGDGVVNSADGVAALGGYTSSSPYYHSIFADLDGDGSWTSNDVVIARARLGTKL